MYEYIWLQKRTTLCRYTKTKLSDHYTYFGVSKFGCKTYNTKDKSLHFFRTKHDLKLLNASSINNIKLLKKDFPSDVKVISRFGDIEERGFHMPADDYTISQLLCQSGFNGYYYSAYLPDNIPQEVMLCSPKDHVSFLKRTNPNKTFVSPELLA